MSRPAVEHILRANLPWRPGDEMTECGRPVAEFASVLTRDQAIAKFRDLGKARALMTTCVTCAQTTDRHATWETNPAAVMARHCDSYGARWSSVAGAQERQLNDELRALALLAQAHREEFDQLLDGLTATGDLTAARRERQRRG
jgi:hypothetical protein